MKSFCFLSIWVVLASGSLSLSQLAWGDLLSEKGSFIVISDIDDTLKITHVSSLREVVYQGIWGTQTFTGMAELFQELYSEAREIVYLSGAPQSTQGGVQDTLVPFRGFPPGYFRLSNWLNWESTETFKTNELNLLKGNPILGGLPFLTFGDDVQSDPEIYLTFRNAHPGLQMDYPIYIREVSGRWLPEGVIRFHTAFDVALREVGSGRLRPDQAIRVGNAILDSNQPELLIPSFAVCPQRVPYLLEQISAINTELAETALLIKERVESYCKNVIHQY